MPFIQVPTLEQPAFLRWASLIGKTQSSTVVPQDLYDLFRATKQRVSGLASRGVTPVVLDRQAGTHAFWARNDLEGRMIWDRTNFGQAYPMGALRNAPSVIVKAFNDLVSAFIADSGLSPSKAIAEVGKTTLSAVDKAKVFLGQATVASGFSTAASLLKPASTRKITDPLTTPFDAQGKPEPTGGAEEVYKPISIYGSWGSSTETSSDGADSSDPEFVYDDQGGQDQQEEQQSRDSSTGLLVIGGILLAALLLLKGK